MNVHDLIKYERRKRGIPAMFWSREMARLAQSQANYCAKVGRLIHSDRYAYQGGENLAEGPSNFTPRAIVNCWLNSKAGHREYLMSPRVRKAGVGIAKSGGKTFVAWAFSDEPPSYPDCPWYKPSKPKAVKGLGNKILRQSLRKQSLLWVAKLKRKIEYIVKHRQIPRWLIKLCLSLITLGGFAFLVSYSYSLVIQHSKDALEGSIILIVGITALVYVIKLLQGSQYRWVKPSFKLTTLSVIVILLILAFAGVQPLAGYKDTLITKLDINDSLNNGDYAEISPGQIAGVDGWFVSLDGGKWEGNVATVKVSLCNQSEVRRYLMLNYDLVAIDSTGKVIEPWTCKPGDDKGEFTPGLFATYDKEFYPNECWAGELMFTMSPYSGETKLYITRFNHQRKYMLFTFGSPQ